MAISDGWSGYLRLKDAKHQPKVVGPMAAHIPLPWIHRVFGNAKRWTMGVYHGLRKPHLQRYLDEVAFRFNRRKTPQAAFASLLRFGGQADSQDRMDRKHFYQDKINIGLTAQFEQLSRSGH